MAIRRRDFDFALPGSASRKPWFVELDLGMESRESAVVGFEARADRSVRTFAESNRPWGPLLAVDGQFGTQPEILLLESSQDAGEPDGGSSLAFADLVGVGVEVSDEVSLPPQLPPYWGITASATSVDLDGDGDDELILFGPEPNEFAAVQSEDNVLPSSFLAYWAVTLDRVAEGWQAIGSVTTNDIRLQTMFPRDYGAPSMSTLAIDDVRTKATPADMDGDGDLDLFVVALENRNRTSPSEDNRVSYVLPWVLWNENGALTRSSAIDLPKFVDLDAGTVLGRLLRGVGKYAVALVDLQDLARHCAGDRVAAVGIAVTKDANLDSSE